MQHEPAAAEFWVSELATDSIAQQIGTSAISRVITNKDPMAAFGLVKDLADQKIRNRAVMHIASTWARQEPDRIDFIAAALQLGPKTTARLKSSFQGRY
jgi:hypothetical protein